MKRSMKKLSIAVVLICTVLLSTACSSSGIFANDYTIDHDAPYFKDYECEPWNMQIYGMDESYVTPSEKVEPYKTAEAFTYELKESYGTREEIAREIADINACHMAFTDNVAQVPSESEQVYYTCVRRLIEEIKKYPPTKEQIDKLQADYFYETVEANNEFIKGFEENVENRDRKSVEFAIEKLAYETTKEINELAQRDFEKGKITAQEACYLTVTCGGGIAPEKQFPIYGLNFV